MKNTDFQKTAAGGIKKKASGIKTIPVCLLFVLIFAAFFSNINAQEIVDETVAIVSVGERTSVITHKDLLLQLASQPGVPLEPPTSADLKRALQLLINQRVIGLRVPMGSIDCSLSAPTQKEFDNEMKRVLAQFPSIAELEKRLRIVGFDSVRDDDFRRIIEQRLQIQKYLDIAFRSRVVIAPEEEARYYREVFVPDFRRRNPGILLPTLDEKRPQINQILTEPKVASDIEKYLESAKRLAKIVILSDDLKL